MSKRKQVQVPIEKIQEQDRFIEAIAEKNSRFYAIHQTKPKYMIRVTKELCLLQSATL